MNARRTMFAAQALVLVLAQGAVAVPSSAADANAAGATVSRTVRVGDLDLSTASGQRTLERRLKQAAWKVCEITVPMQGPNSINHGRCIKMLSDAARTEVYAARQVVGPLVVRGQPR